MAATVSRSRGSTASRSDPALCLLVWLTTLTAHTGRPAPSRTGTATAISPGSMSWSSVDQPWAPAAATRSAKEAAASPCPRGSAGKPVSCGSAARRRRQRSQPASSQSPAKSAPGAPRSAGSWSPMRKVRDIARRRVAWWTKRTPSPSGTAMDTDSSRPSARASASGPSRSGKRLAAR